MKALSFIFKIFAYICSCLEQIVEKMGLQPQTGTDEKIFLGNAVWVFEPKLSPLSTARISNEST